MSLDVSEHSDLMGSTGDRIALAAFAPNAALVNHTQIGQRPGCVLLGDADPFPRVVIGKAGQQMQMMVIQGRGNRLDAVGPKRSHDHIKDTFSLDRGQMNGISFEKPHAPVVESFAACSGRRMPVVTHDVLAVMPGAPASRVAS